MWPQFIPDFAYFGFSSFLLMLTSDNYIMLSRNIFTKLVALSIFIMNNKSLGQS